MIEPGRIAALGGRVAIEHRALAAAGHVDCERGEPGAQDEGRRAQPVLLPAVDATPMHDHRRPGDAGRQLQIAHERLALERQLDDRQRRLEVLCRLAEQAQRMRIRLLLAGRAGHRVAADAAIVEGERVNLGELVAGRARARARVGLGLVVEPDPAPQPRPQIAVEARERAHHPLGILAADVLERIEPPGAAHHLVLDLLQRARRRGGLRRHRRRSP